MIIKRTRHPNKIRVLFLADCPFWIKVNTFHGEINTEYLQDLILSINIIKNNKKVN